MADQIKTGLPELSKLLSEPLKIGELSKIYGPSARIGVTTLWREALKGPYTTVSFDFEMKPQFDLEDLGIKPPDDPIPTKPGS